MFRNNIKKIIKKKHIILNINTKARRLSRLDLTFAKT